MWPFAPKHVDLIGPIGQLSGILLPRFSERCCGVLGDMSNVQAATFEYGAFLAAIATIECVEANISAADQRRLHEYLSRRLRTYFRDGGDQLEHVVIAREALYLYLSRSRTGPAFIESVIDELFRSCLSAAQHGTNRTERPPIQGNPADTELLRKEFFFLVGTPFAAFGRTVGMLVTECRPFAKARREDVNATIDRSLDFVSLGGPA